MSAGNFEWKVYASNSGVNYPIRVQPETSELVIDGVTNSQPIGDPLPGAQPIRVGAGRRQAGVAPRKIRVRFTGDGPDGYEAQGTHSVVVFREQTFNDYTVVPGLTGTYLGEPVRVVGCSPENPL